MKFLKGKIIPPEDVKAIREFKYKGRDDSIYYNYIISPLCELTVKITPKWVAPNLITFIGFIFVLVLFLIGLYYSGLSGVHPVPEYACYAISILYHIYFFLDNLDGKQARTIGASSPLGTIMDHCCDSMTSALITLTIGSCAGLDDVLCFAVLYSMVSFPFFSTIWDENLNKVFVLPVINGVSDGAIVTSGIIASIGYFSRSIFFQYTTIFGYTLLNRYWIVALFFLFGFTFFLIK